MQSSGIFIQLRCCGQVLHDLPQGMLFPHGLVMSLPLLLPMKTRKVKRKRTRAARNSHNPKEREKKQKQDDGHSEEEEEEDAEHAPLGELGYDDDDELDDPTGNDTNNGKNPKGEKASKKTGAGKTSVKKKPCTRTGKKRPDHEERLLLFQLSVLCFVMGFNG